MFVSGGYPERCEHGHDLADLGIGDHRVAAVRIRQVARGARPPLRQVPDRGLAVMITKPRRASSLSAWTAEGPSAGSQVRERGRQLGVSAVSVWGAPDIAPLLVARLYSDSSCAAPICACQAPAMPRVPSLSIGAGSRPTRSAGGRRTGSVTALKAQAGGRHLPCTCEPEPGYLRLQPGDSGEVRNPAQSRRSASPVAFCC